jgi:hypothetical protein
MLTQKQLVLFLLFCIGSYLIRLKSPWLEWNDLNHKIYGTEVTFSEPMAYMKLSKGHLDREFGRFKEQVAIGRMLMRLEFAENRKKIAKATEIEKIPVTATFVIKQSYWRQHNWLHEGFSGDTLYFVLEDSNGVRSSVAYFYFASSNLPELSNLDYIYKEF